MALPPALLNSMTALKAFGTAVRVTSDNVANANNEDYNKRKAKFETRQYGGVNVAYIERVANLGLTKDLRNAVSLAVRDETTAQYYSRIEELVGTVSSTTALADKMEAFISAYKAFEAAPESGAAEREVVLAGQLLVSEMHRVSNGIEQIDRNVKDDIIVTVTELNRLLNEIHELNQKIVTEEAIGRPTAGLENTRDGKLADLSEIMEIKTFERAYGSITVYSSSAIDLVDAVAVQFTWNETLQTLVKSGTTTDYADDISNGRLRAQMDFIRTDAASVASTEPRLAPVQKLRDQLDGLAQLLADNSANSFHDAYSGGAAPGLFLGVAPYTADWDQLFFQPLDVVNDTPADIDRFNIQIRPALVDGTANVPTATANAVILQLDANSRNLTAGAITLTNETYAGVASAILARLVSNSGVVARDSALESTIRDDLKVALDSEVRVDIDEEMAILSMLQNSYGANARVVNAINELFEELTQVIR